MVLGVPGLEGCLVLGGAWSRGGVWSGGYLVWGLCLLRGAPGGDPPTGRLLLQVVRILLECILVELHIVRKGTGQRCFKRKIQIPQRASISNGLFPPPDSDSDSDSDTDSCTMQVFSLVQIQTLIP